MNNIRVLRRRQNLTQDDVAKELNISQQAIAKWETGAAMPRADKLIELAKVLGCTVDELLIDGEEAECNDNSRD